MGKIIVAISTPIPGRASRNGHTFTGTGKAPPTRRQDAILRSGHGDLS